MKFGILSLVAAGALALTAGSASAQPRYYGGGHNHGHGHGYNHGYGGHLDYHRGHYHYHNGGYRSGPLYPAYSSYSYNSGFGGPSIGLSIGSGTVTPFYNYGYSQPYYGGYNQGYYGGYNRGYYGGPRW